MSAGRREGRFGGLGPASTIAVRPIAAAFTAVALIACGADNPTGSGDFAQVRGRVVSEPSCPVETAGAECSPQPLATTVEAFEGEGQAAGHAEPTASAEAGADGSFELDLAPGTYTLVADPPGGLGAPATEKVTVGTGQEAEVTLTIDSGIR